MNEQIASEAGYALSLKYDGTPPAKPGHTYALRVGALLEILGKLNYGEWVIGPTPDPKSATWWGAVARCRLQGKLLGSPEGITVYLDLYNHHAKFIPKDIAFSLSLESGLGLVVGTYTDIIRYTDVRTMTSVYDGIPWTEQNFKFQLQADARNQRLHHPPEQILLQVAAAVKYMADVGITECKHVLLSAGEMYGVAMEPYLVGMYGTVPCAIHMNHRNVKDMHFWFHTLSPMGLAQAGFGHVFGHIKVSREGELVESEIDLAELFSTR